MDLNKVRKSVNREEKIITPYSYQAIAHNLVIESVYDPYSESTKYKCRFCGERGELKDKDAATLIDIEFHHDCSSKK